MGAVSERLPATLKLDAADERAWLGGRAVALTPKAFAVLSHLAANRDRLVTKQELLDTLWPGIAVSDGALSTSIREIRRALGDGVSEPRFIQTVHRRGYRFIGEVRAPAGAARAPAAVALAPLVGRAAELTRLEEWMALAESGARQVVLISGEAGVGKTAIVDAFLARAAGRPGSRVARGQCIEAYGAAEAYLPWLDALSSLCRAPGGDAIREVLGRTAPMWLAQLPALVALEEREALLRQVAGAPPERMLREMAETLELLARDQLLVVALEDLHWGDHSSLDLLASVARRREPARLLVLATLRPAESSAAIHPRRMEQELSIHGLCRQLALGFLPEGAVAEYLGVRFPGSPPALASVLHRRTDGNALFMVNTADYLAARGLIEEDAGRWSLRGDLRMVEAAAPASLRALIDRQLDRVGEEDRALLRAASIAGAEFADLALAHALSLDPEQVSARCESLARRGAFLRFVRDEDWPDGSATRRYAFIHALYADVLYEASPPSRRVRLHRAVAERLERGYGQRASQIAAELATHFERSRNPSRAVAYLSQAADNAAERAAYPEVISSLSRALDLLSQLPDDASRSEREFALRMALAPAEMITKGYAAVEVDAAYARAEVLSRKQGDERQLFNVLMGRSAAVLLAGRTGEATALAEECCRIAHKRSSPRYLTQAETALGISRFFRGELVAASEGLERSQLAYGAVKQPPPGFRLLHDPGAAGRSYAAWARWMLGHPDRARAESEAAIALARGLSHPFSLAFALAFGAFVQQACGDIRLTRERAEQTIAVCREHGFAMYLAVGTMFESWAIARESCLADGIARMEQGLVDYGATGARLVQPYFLTLLTQLALDNAEPDRARTYLARAREVARANEERMYDAELRRLDAEIAVRGERAERDAAERSFRAALEIARSQHAGSLEIRAATGLAAHLARLGRGSEGLAVLRDAMRGIHGGFETHDVRAATQAIETLEAAPHAARRSHP